MLSLLFEDKSKLIYWNKKSNTSKTKILQQKYGEEAWDNVRRLANIDSPTFSIHQVEK